MQRTFIAILLALCLCAGGASAFAANDPWSEEYYRASDVTDEMTDAEQEDLDALCIDFMKTYKLDIALLAVTPEYYEGETLEEHAEAYYKHCGFGYGDGADGFVMIYDAETEEAALLAFGAARDAVPQDYLDYVARKAPELRAEHRIWGVLYGTTKYLRNYMEDPTSYGGTRDSGDVSADSAAPAFSGAEKPAWYPDDPQSFAFFHNETAPRVVDAADIFTDAEERRLEARLGEIRAELQKDLVIYTDTTDYGLGHHICAADFYDYGGYGCGDEYEGACLFIDMDPDNRGWYCACTGSETKALYTEDIANQIDDALYEYMAAGASGESGAFAEGVADWAENFRTLYAKGTPFAPEWYPEQGTTLTPHHDANAPRVVDEIGLLTDAEVAELTEKAATISQKYGVDVAIHTMRSPTGMDYDEVARQYYTYMGYGVGDNYDGILLTVFKRPGYYATSRITGVGSVAEKLTETNYDRLLGYYKGEATEDHYFRGAAEWLRQTDHLLRTGRVARSNFYWGAIAALGALIGAIFGGIALGGAKKKMAPPRMQTNADAYFDGSASRISDGGAVFLYSTTSRRYDPKESSSSGSRSSGSSHHSTYHSSYHGSSGRSHSGSGRRF